MPEISPDIQDFPAIDEDTSTTASTFWRIVFAEVGLIFLGLIVGAIAWFMEMDFISTGTSQIGDPIERGRIDLLKSIALVLWLLGLLVVPFTLWLSRPDSPQSERIKKAARILMVVVPAIWFVFSAWVILDIIDAVDATRPDDPTLVTWLISPPSQGPTSGAVFNLGVIKVEFDPTRTVPAEFTIPADMPIQFDMYNSDNVTHSFIIEPLGVAVNPVPVGWQDRRHVIVTVPAGDYVFHCNQPGHESEVGGTIHVVDTPIVADVTFDGTRLSPERVSIPANQLVAIRFVNESGPTGDLVFVEIPGVSNDDSNVRFAVPQETPILLVLNSSAGEFEYWGQTYAEWNKSDGKAGDVPGGRLVVSD